MASRMMSRTANGTLVRVPQTARPWRAKGEPMAGVRRVLAVAVAIVLAPVGQDGRSTAEDGGPMALALHRWRERSTRCWAAKRQLIDAWALTRS